MMSDASHAPPLVVISNRLPFQVERRGGKLHLTRSPGGLVAADRKSTRLNSSHLVISYAVFCLKKKTNAVPILHTIFDYLPAHYDTTWYPTPDDIVYRNVHALTDQLASYDDPRIVR